MLCLRARSTTDTSIKQAYNEPCLCAAVRVCLCVRAASIYRATVASYPASDVLAKGLRVVAKDEGGEKGEQKKDKYGIPVLRFNYKWSDYERKQAKHTNETVKEIVDNIGGHMLWENKGPDHGLGNPGSMIHEVGTTRMGSNPKISVVNEYELSLNEDGSYQLTDILKKYQFNRPK